MASPKVDKYQFGIMHVIRNSFLSQNYHYSNYWDVVAIEAVHNSDLEEQFQEKRRDFIHVGRTKDELIERLLMGCYIKDEDIKFISLNGLQCGKHGTTSYLGNGRKGVTLGKHADILLKSFYNDGYEQCWIVVYKVICGRQKEVLHIQTPPYREPMQDADCHVSILAPVPAEDCLPIQDIKAQVFMFDKDENGDFLRRPRQCVPIACVKFKRATPIEGETKAANQTILDISIGGDTKDSFTILKDSLAKMKESFVLLSKETVINSKTNHANQQESKVPVNGSRHRNVQQPPTEMNKGTIKSETHKRAVLDKRKLIVSTNSESVVKKMDLSSDSATDVEPYELETTSSKKCINKESRTQKEILKDRKLKPVSVNVSSSEERSTARSTTSKVSSGEIEKAEKNFLTKKRGQLPEVAPRSVVVKDQLTRSSSADASSRTHRNEGKCPSRTDVLTGGATVGKKITTVTDRKHENADSRLMPVVSNRKTRLIEALPVSLLSSSPSLTSAFSRRPSVVGASSNEVPRQSPSVVAPSNEVPRQSKSILRNPIIQNGSPISALSSLTSGSQSSSNIYSRLTTSSVKQKCPSSDTEAPQNNVKQTHNACQITDNSAYKHKKKIAWNFLNNQPTSNSHLDSKSLSHISTSSPLEAKPLFHILTSSPLEEKPPFHIPISLPLEAKIVPRISTICSTPAVESNTKTALKSCLATSLNSISIAPWSKDSSSLHKEPNSNFVSQSKSSAPVQTSDTAETQPTQTPTVTYIVPPNRNALCLLSRDAPNERVQTGSITLVPPVTKTSNDPISFVQKQTKSASVMRSCLTSKTKTGIETVSPVLLSDATSQKHPSNLPRTIAKLKATHSSKAEPMSEFQSQTALPSLNGNFTSTCLSRDANRAICLPPNIDRSSSLKESGVKQILKTAPNDDCVMKNSYGSVCKTDVADIQPDATPIVVIPQKKLLLLQHGFISSITKQLAADLNDAANLLRSSKSEKVNRRDKLALLSLREINSKFMELTPLCAQYKQLFRHLKDGHPVRLPELDALYSQEYTMNECCNVLGRVFSELKTSQLKAETVPQKTSLAVAWLVDSKIELISCINSIKGIVENVLLTCDLRSVPSANSSPSTPEANCAENKRALQTGQDLESIGSSAATQNAARYEPRSPAHVQLTETLATKRSSQEDRTPIIPVTTETKSQRLPEINETMATVSTVDHLFSLDRSHSEYEAGSRSTYQNGEVAPPSGNCLDDAAKEPGKDGATTHLQSEASNSGDIITEGYSEQNLNGSEPNALICPSSASAVDKSGQLEEETQAEGDIDRSSTVCTVSRDSSQPSSESNSDGGALISSEGGILSPEHPCNLAAVGADEPSNVPRPIKTERSDPPNLMPRPPQTIILGADDFIPPDIPTSGGNASSIVQSVSKGHRSVNNNDSPLTDFCSNIEIGSVVRLEEGVLKQDGIQYESCVSLESSTFNLDSLDEIPPLLTPDSAFDYSSIVYNVKSDEPPILEANTDETLRNIDNVGSALDVSARDSSALAESTRNSDRSVLSQRNSPVLAVTQRKSPASGVSQRNSPALVVIPWESPTLAITPRDSPTLVVTPRDSPTLALTPRDSLTLAVTSSESSTLPITAIGSPPLVVTPSESSTLPMTPIDSPPLVVTSRVSPALSITLRDSPALVSTPRDLSTFDAPRKNSSTDSSDLVLLISGTRASAIIMSSDDMVASGSHPSDIKMGADDEATVKVDARVGAHVSSHVDPDAPAIDVQMKTSLQGDDQFAAVKETVEEMDKREGSYYVRVVGELTDIGSVTADKEIDAQRSMNFLNQNLVNPTTKFMPDKEVCRMATPYSQRVKSDQLDRSDDLPKKVLEVCLQPSPPQLIISHKSVSIDLSTLNLNSDQMELKSEQTLAEMTSSLYNSTSHYDETAYVALLSGGVRICGSDQSHYVFKIEPNDDFDPDPVCSYNSPNAPELRSASAKQVLFDVCTGRDDRVCRRVYELDSSKPGDTTNSQERHVEKDSPLSSHGSTETLETVVCKSPCLTLLPDLENQSMSSQRLYESDNLDTERVPQSHQEQIREFSTVVPSNEPETHICRTVVFPLIQFSSEPVHSEVPDVSSLILSPAESASSVVPGVSSLIQCPSESVPDDDLVVSSLILSPSESVSCGFPVVSNSILSPSGSAPSGVLGVSCSILSPSESVANGFHVVSSSIQSPSDSVPSGVPGVPSSILSPSDSVTNGVFPGVSSDSQEVIFLRERQRLSVSLQQMPQSFLQEMRGCSSSRPTLSDYRSASPPTVYTEPPQSPPPETIPMKAVIKQEIPDDLDSLVGMKRVPNQRAFRKRKRESRQNQEEPPIVVVSDEGDESGGCSASSPKQHCSDWSIQSGSKDAGNELRESIVRFVEFCSSDAFRAASGKPFRTKATADFEDHHIEAAGDSDPAGVEDKLIDVRDMTRPKMASVCFSSIYKERQIKDDGGKTNDEGGFKSEEKRRSLRCSRSRYLSYDRDSASCGSRIRDAVHADRRGSRDPARWRTPYRGSDDQRERLSTRLSSGSHESLRDRRHRDEGGKALPLKARSSHDRSNSRWQNIDVIPGEQSRRSEGRSNHRRLGYKYSPAEFEDQRSRSTRPMTAVSRSFETRDYGIRRDTSGDREDSTRKFIDPSKLKRQFWSKGHPRFKCHEGCDQACVAASTAPQDSDKRHRCVGSNSGTEAIQRIGNSSQVQDVDILEETLKLNLEMLESNQIDDDGEMELRRDDVTVLVKRDTKRPPLQRSTDPGLSRRRGRRGSDGDGKDHEAEAKEEEETDDFQSTASSKRSKTLSRLDKNSDCEDRFCSGPMTLYDDDGCSMKKTTSVSTDGMECVRASQPSRCGPSSVGSGGGSGSEGRIPREIGDEEVNPSLNDISRIRMNKSTLQTGRHGAAPTSSSAAAAVAAAPVQLSRTSVTYVTEILQTSNFSTQVCRPIEKYKKVVI